MNRCALPLVALVLGATLLLAGSPAGSSAPAANVAGAQAFGIRVIVPGQAGATGGYVSAPEDQQATVGGFAYPADGSLMTTGPITLSASAVPAVTALASASVDVADVSLFGGEVTVSAVDAKVNARADDSGGSGDFTGTGVTGISGTAVAGTALGDWGTITTSGGSGESTESSTARGWHGSVVALDIRLTADHDGLPAGTEIQVGYTAVNVQAETTPPPPVVPDVGPDRTQTPANVTSGEVRGSAAARKRAAAPKPLPPPTAPPVTTKIPTVHPLLTAGRYVFPVYGPTSYGDTFGAARADVSWHHGDDIFAPLGAPILAVADGTVFSVGWNKIGGWRLWLRDRQGNQFYYAHLSAYSPFAKNGAQVRAGTVLGFVGNTGDAEGTPYHLHFEVHPVSLLSLGYDGAVDPTPYLDAWKRLQDIRFSTAGVWLPGLLHLTGSRAPEPGAILLRVSDISNASGLDPGSLQRALTSSLPNGAALVGALPRQPTSTGPADLGRG